jgi:methylaspartate ammonia-lyase
MNIDEMMYIALVKRYESQIAEAAATLKIYFDSPIGIGEHPQHIDEMDKLLGKIGDAQGKLDTLVTQWDNKNNKPLPF